MPHILQNENIELHIDHPTENYNHARFDWTGKIVELKYKGISVAGYEKEGAGSNEYKGKGFYNEFGIDNPIGFSECKEGEWFHKIGVGLLQKVDEGYIFHHNYRIKPLDFKVKKNKDKIIITAKSEIVNGYAYQLDKKIKLKENGFEIHYHLKNTGTKPIETDEYNHNFVMMGNEKIGKDYFLKLPFRLKPGLIGEVVNPNNVVEIRDKKMGLKDSPESPFFYSFINGKNPVSAQWEIFQKKLGIGVREKGDFTTSKVNLWGWAGAISPELFNNIKVNPGMSQSWKRSYEIREL
jgi:hypothetical protein